MVYMSDVEFYKNSIVSPDGYSLQVETVQGENFDDVLKLISNSPLNIENLQKLYGDNVNLVFQNMTIIYGDKEVGLYSESTPKVPGPSVKTVNGIQCFVPPENCVVIMDTDDGDNDPDTNDFYFIFTE